MYIDGAWVEAVSREWLDAVDPATGAVAATVPAGDGADIDRAVLAARRAFDSGLWWPNTTARERGSIVSFTGSRAFVEESIYDDALNAMIARAADVRLGDGRDPTTTIGPLVSAAQRANVERYLEIGARKAKLASLGELPADPKLQGGYFVPPVIFVDASNDAQIAREEMFGPVMTVIPFIDTEEVVRLVNNNEYGLAAAIWTGDLNKALRLARRIRAGTVWVNDTQASPTEAPGGGFKQSGIGRECGPWGIEDYVELKHVFVRLTGSNA